MKVEELAVKLPETKAMKKVVQEIKKAKEEAKKVADEQEVIKKKEELKTRREEAKKPKPTPAPIPRKPYVSKAVAKKEKGEGIDIFTQTDKSYVMEMKAKIASERARRLALVNGLTQPTPSKI